MNPCELTAVVSTLALVIANNVQNDDELDLLSAIFTQLGDTLATISIQRAILNNISQGDIDNKTRGRLDRLPEKTV